MADREQQKGYSYHEMSNQVLQGNRRRRYGEPTGEVESLRGRGDVGRMGDRVAKAEKTEFTAKVEKARKKRQKREHTSSSSRQPLAAAGGQTILDMGDLTGYQPSTEGK